MSLREFAKLPGRIISQMPAVGPVARIFSKNLLHFIDNTIKSAGLLSADKEAWNIKIPALTPAVTSELQFWSQYSFPPVPLQPQRGIVQMVTDASDTRIGAFLLLPGLQYEFSEPLPTSKGERLDQQYSTFECYWSGQSIAQFLYKYIYINPPLDCLREGDLVGVSDSQ